MRLKYTLTACSDCICFVANGDIPHDRTNLPELIIDQLGADSKYLVNAENCDENGEMGDNDTGEDWFSWSWCECCGDTQGGMRNRLAVLEGTLP